MKSNTTGAHQDAVRERLQARARELGAELRDAEAERAASITSAPTDDVQDSGDQGEQRAREIVLSAGEARDAEELADIDAAIQRLADGSYGECVDCGVDIAPERLQVQPAAARCIDCQERFEKAQALQAPSRTVV